MPVSAFETAAADALSNSARIVESAIQMSSQLATLPAIAIQVIRLTEDPNSTTEDLNKVLVNDPAISVRILKLVNSGFYGQPGEINSIHRAIMVIGLKAVKNIAVATSLAKLLRGGVICPQFDAGDLWTHCVAVATAARLLADRSRLVHPDEAFLAGLIHDVGIMIEMQACRQNFVPMIQKLIADDSLSFRAAEEDSLGATHEAFGAGLCKAWTLPISLQLVTGYHHRPWELAEADRRLPTLVHIADILAARHGLGYTRTVETDSIDPELLSSLNLTEADVETVSEMLPEVTREAQALMSDA